MSQVSYEERKAQALHKEAAALGNSGDYAGAMEKVDRALSLMPNHPPFLFTKAMVFEGLKQYAHAEPIWRNMAQKFPNQVAGWFYLARACNNQHKRDEAITYYKKALAIDPNALEPLVNLADELMQHKKVHDPDALEAGIKDAVVFLERAVKYHPNSIEALNGLALALLRLGKPAAALPYFQKAHLGSPTNLEVLVNFGHTLMQLERYEEAGKCYQMGMKLGDWFSEFMYSQYLLLMGDFENGLKHFDTRFNDADFPHRKLPSYVWKGESLKDKTLYIWTEQGIGDEIMHAGFLPDVISRGGKVMLEADPRLITVYARSFPSVEVIKRRIHESEPALPILDADYNVANDGMMGLTKSRMDYAPYEGYLKPDTAKVAMYRERYAHLGGMRKIGISWKSRKTDTSRARSIGIMQWLPLLQLPNTQFFNLQYGDYQHELDELKKETGIHVISDPDVNPLKDVEHMMALSMNLDRVISCANSTVHITGSIGVPTWVMVPIFPSWRWQLKREDNIWYPHVRLFRQNNPENWDNVFARMVEELNKKTPRLI